MDNQQELLSLFLTLVNRQESEVLDFKRDAYNLSREDKKLELVKDVVCMYNTPREEDAHIILGVKKFSNGTFDLRGIDPNTNPQHIDHSDLQGIFLDKFRVDPVPAFRIDILKYDGKEFGIITIPIRRVGPCKVINGDGEKLKSGIHLYFRRGPSNDLTRTPEDTYEIMQWFKNNLTPSTPLQDLSQWDRFLEVSFIDEVTGFDLSRRYILVTSLLKDEKAKNLSILGEIPATLMLDFDPQSDINGLLSEIQERPKRSLHPVVKRDRPSINPEGTTYWFFARGLEGRDGTVELGDYKAWKRSYGGEIG